MSVKIGELPAARNGVRISLDAHIVMRRTGRTAYGVKILDLSPRGCRARFIERPNLNEVVWLKLDNLQAIPANVCWVTDGNAGLEFERPIHPAVFELLLRRLGH